MRERERLGQDVEQRLRGIAVAFVEPRLDQLEIPVAQLTVDEVVERERGVREVEALDQVADLGLRTLEPREDPAVLDGGGRHGAAYVGLDPQEDQARGVPELVRQLLALRDLVL